MKQYKKRINNSIFYRFDEDSFALKYTIENIFTKRVQNLHINVHGYFHFKYKNNIKKGHYNFSEEYGHWFIFNDFNGKFIPDFNGRFTPDKYPSYKLNYYL